MALTKPPANVLELPLETRAEMAMKAAIEELIIDHAKRGLPLAIWRDGEVVELSAAELKSEAARILAK